MVPGKADELGRQNLGGRPRAPGPPLLATGVHKGCQDRLRLRWVVPERHHDWRRTGFPNHHRDSGKKWEPVRVGMRTQIKCVERAKDPRWALATSIHRGHPQLHPGFRRMLQPNLAITKLYDSIRAFRIV